jgi:hypothetical protein
MRLDFGLKFFDKLFQVLTDQAKVAVEIVSEKAIVLWRQDNFPEILWNIWK